ncbi:uncharacterized protein JCM15063_000012 [Sporobolomyces koalae]|uniref:uncharacterized protein n=1 Tax=Sporobolomyces koalae TaxID=500713 RepID=UPI00316C749C
MSDYAMQEPHGQAVRDAEPSSYKDRSRSPPPARDDRDSRDDRDRRDYRDSRDSRDSRDYRDRNGDSRRYVPPARPSNAPDAQPSNVLGVFGLSIRTREEDLEHEFGRAGRVEKVVIVYDQRSGRSRGFGFVTLGSVSDAEKAIQDLNGMELHGRRLRVDFSATNRPHDPTPGEYRGPRRPEEDYRFAARGPAQGSRYGDSGDRWAGGRSDDRFAPPSREDRYAAPSRDDRYAVPSRDDRGSRYGGSDRRDDRYSSSSRRDRRDDDRDYEREPRRRDSRSPGGGRDRSPVRRERSPVREGAKEDY